ncbi:hypothetical protein FACS1894184_03650 [Clostridia bacterium]|nr:hypothetical protein FACS1894184_03650 [Clostridia bacterium]
MQKSGTIEKYINANKLILRIQGIGDASDDIGSSRAYDRIISNPFYVLLGAGEGEYLSRFGVRKEIHSTLGNAIFSYGSIGLISYVFFMISPIKHNNKFIYLIIGIVVYGLTHNGSRNSLFYIFISLLYYANVNDDIELGVT